MSRTTAVLAILAVTLVGGLAGSAAAQGEDSERFCLSSSYDPKGQGAEPICVWVPIGR